MKKLKIVVAIVVVLIVLIYFLFFNATTSLFTFVLKLKISNKINRYDYTDLVRHYGFGFGEAYVTEIGYHFLGASIDDYVFNLWFIKKPVDQEYTFNQYDLSKFSVLLNDSINDRHIYAYYSSNLIEYPVIVYCKNIVMEIYPMHKLDLPKAWRRIQEFIPKCKVDGGLETDYNIPLKNGKVIPKKEVLENLKLD